MNAAAADLMPQPEPENETVSSEKLTSEEKFKLAWLKTFGISQVQIHFHDQELDARVYTLDSDTGYRIQEKKVKLAEPADAASAAQMIEQSTRLAFPEKSRRGEAHGRARLCNDDIVIIREWAATYITKGETPPWKTKAAELHVGEGTLRDIVRRRTWTHVP